MQGHDLIITLSLQPKNYLIFSRHCQLLRKRIGCYGGSSTDYHRLRTGELRGALWDEIDFNKAIWRYPLHV